MSQITVHRWSLDYIDRTKNAARFYKIYVYPTETGWQELRHWGRLGTDGRSDPFDHITQDEAIKSATKKAYAERGKGYTLQAEDSFPFNNTKRFTPKFLEHAANVELNRVTEMGLTKSELDALCHDAQMMIVTLQDSTQTLDLDAIHTLKLRWNEAETQYKRTSAAMKMADMLAGQRMLEDARKVTI